MQKYRKWLRRTVGIIPPTNVHKLKEE